MKIIYDTLSNKWDELKLNNMNESSIINEESLILELGLIILNNNLNLLNYDDSITKKIINKYLELFDFKSTLDSNIRFDMRISPFENDLIGRIYEEHIHTNGTRKSSGQFYSPNQIVQYITNNLRISTDLDLENKKFIDIACGTGIFLLGAIQVIISTLRNRNYLDEQIFNIIQANIYGLDINSLSCLITKVNLFNYLVLELSSKSIINNSSIEFKIFKSNSIEINYESDNFANIYNLSEDIKIKNRIGQYKNGFDYILGNPPYLEAKKMPKSLKEICKQNFPELIYGAFDLYIAFIGQCNKLVSNSGKISLILPNKFMVAKYAIKVRKYILNNFKIIEIDDLSEMDIFHKADVYPIVLFYKNELPDAEHKVATKISIQDYNELQNNTNTSYVLQSLYLSLGNLTTLFCLPNEGNFDNTFENFFNNGTSISNYLTFRSTVSFHKKGLREQYITNRLNKDNPNIKRYLGGRSYSKKNEVSKFKIDWEGFYINYDQTGLKTIGNSLPPLTNFEQEKIIFCQHAKEITATYDGTGEWISKDVFPIAFHNENSYNTSLSIKYFTGLLNSKLFSFIYGIIYKGIQISAGYYHYLPTWMGVLPVIEPTIKSIHVIEDLVDQALIADNKEEISAINEEINNIIYEIYNVTDAQKKIIESFFY